jgi:hypothetical protein
MDDLALRLEQRTELNQAYSDYERESSQVPEFVRAFNVRDYGHGLVEVGYSSVQLTPRSAPDPDKQESLSPAEKERKKANNLARSIRRSKAQARRKCMAGGLDHLLTLTYRENIQDERLAYTHFARFIRLVRKRYPGWKYLAVHEFQKRGSIHFHCAVSGFQDVRYLRQCWLKVVSQGNIDIKAPKSRGSSKWRLPKLAQYLTKYITKNATTANARQRYRVAEGIEIPSKKAIIRFHGFTDFISDIFDSVGSTCRHHWKPEGSPYGWACSW